MKLRLFVPLLFISTLVACKPNGDSSSSTNIEEIVNKQSINLVDVFNQEEEEYLIFFHSDTCKSCKAIIGDVASFAEENIVKTYFLNINQPNNKPKICSKDELIIGVNNVEDLAILGTPTIVKVENGVTTANEGGKEKCLTLLSEERMNHKK